MAWMASTTLWPWTRLFLLLLVSTGPADGTDCGGELTQQAGVITSPNFPGSYPPGYSQCFWTITVADDQAIALSFQRLDLRRRGDQNCYDYLSVYDGPDLSASLIQRLCGYQDESKVADIRLRSSGNQMHLYFYAWSSESWPGFSALYQARNACLPFMYGREECNKSCACNQNNTLYCNHMDGTCVCKEGWTSSLCTVDVDECRNPNSCPDIYSECQNTPGSFECPCKAGFVKNESGFCEGSGACPKGTRPDPSGGNNCTECDDWTFGYNCTLNCVCSRQNTKSCDKVDGLCSCYLNWTGNNCGSDVNECGSPHLACNRTSSQCRNTIGSYECWCKSGYENVDGSQKSCQECGRILTEPSGSIMSSSYGEYNSEKCSWTIKVAEGNVISLNVSEFRHYSSHPSSLSFLDGGNSSSRLIQRLYSVYYYTFSYEGIIRSSGNEMHIALYSSRCSNSWTDLMATYWSHGMCKLFLSCSQFCRFEHGKIGVNKDKLRNLPKTKIFSTLRH